MYKVIYCTITIQLCKTGQQNKDTTATVNNSQFEYLISLKLNCNFLSLLKTKIAKEVLTKDMVQH